MRYGSTNTSKKTYKKGQWAESYACLILILKGYQIVARRLQMCGGEIDILARRRQTLIAIEVKYRPQLDQAVLAVSAQQRQRIMKSVNGWLGMSKWQPQQIRFDVFAITQWGWYRHLENAWGC